MIKRNIIIFLFLFIALIWIICLFLIGGSPPFADEYNHLKTIREIASLNFNKDTFTRNAQLPGYYLLLALLSSIFTSSSLFLMRLLNSIISFITVVVFYLTAKHINPRSAFLKTLQFTFFPIIFVFFFLVYTDILAMLLLLLTFLCVTKKKYFAAGVFGFFSILVRQNNIIWLGFFCAYIFIEEYKLSIKRETLSEYLKKILPLFFSFIVVTIFLIINKGPALTDRTLNSFTFRQENVFFFLLLFFPLFIPQIIFNLKNIFRFIANKPQTILIVSFMFSYYLLFFKADNWYNNYFYFNHFLRNKLLHFMLSTTLWKIFFYIPILLSTFTLFTTTFYKKSHYLLYPFSFLFLSLSWLIEPRYTFIPFTFLLLFRKNKFLVLEYITLTLFIIYTIWIFLGTFRGVFFI